MKRREVLVLLNGTLLALLRSRGGADETTCRITRLEIDRLAPTSVATACPRFTSHTFRVSSYEPDTSCPSGNTATLVTALVCPVSVTIT
jgi:hypothetical protein